MPAATASGAWVKGELSKIKREVITREELKKYDGRQGIVYVAYMGKVYDISRSAQWQKGVHQLTHHAGADLTRALKQAPHDPDRLFRFPVVGTLAD